MSAQRFGHLLVGVLVVACLLYTTISARTRTAAHEQGDASAVRIQLTVKRVGNAAVAECVLAVDGGSVEVFTSDLPCASDDSATWVAVRPGHDPLPRTLAIADPGPGKTVIKPGAVIRGRLDLTQQFASLQAKSATGEVIVFWTYRLRTVDGRTSNRVGGWLSMD